ncbi:MAG TPA: aminoacyl-tRNA hydrolase [Patescibacteria group bacterium]|nr:aminoacyl-tRNA hydrolase [Patescibacteria group bacterium]
MKLIVGLGNPGEKYEATRHNLGFMAVEHFLKDFHTIHTTEWSDDKKLKSDIALIEWQRRSVSSGQAVGERVILAKPKTYMNNSGMAVSLIANYYKIAPSDLWVAYDDLDLPVGSLKIRFGGAAAGHHGVESIMASLNTDKFWRFRMGIGLPHGHKVDGDGVEHLQSRRTVGNVEDYVLGTFGTHDRNKIREVIKACTGAFEVALEKDMTTAMNRFNTK